jgi:KDO2-lipid IV(A) lauroyltransferase
MSVKYAGYRVAQWVSVRRPTRGAFRVAEWFADLRFRASRSDRLAVCDNLSLMAGEPIGERSPRVREVFRHFGRYLVEFFAIHAVAHPALQVEGVSHLTGALSRGRGVIAMTAHLGNWELAAVFLKRMDMPIAAIALPHEDRRMDALFNRQRERCGVSVLPLGRNAARRGLRHLHQGGVLGVLADRDFSDHGVPITLRGRQVTLPSGPATLSLRARAPVVPVFLIREGPWAFRLCVEPPIWPSQQPCGMRDAACGMSGRIEGAWGRGRVGEAVQELTQQYAEVLERYLTRCPEQWLMFQPISPTVRNAGCGMLTS